MKIFDFFKKKKDNLFFFNNFKKVVTGKSTLDDKVINKIEELLILSDISINTTNKIINNLKFQVKENKYFNFEDINKLLKKEIIKLISIKSSTNLPLDGLKKPHIMLFVGVNGVGKTTTIGKLSLKFKNNKNKVLLGAADTFRFGAVSQLKKWANRTNVPLIYKENSSPSSVVYETLKYGFLKSFDIIMIDTAGRLHTNINLMKELSKIERIVKKFSTESNFETVLVLDGTIGQNSVVQLEKFLKFIDINSIIITKLDGSSKGGVIIEIINKFNIPVKYIGIGENLDDLKTFNSKEFVNYFF